MPGVMGRQVANGRLLPVQGSWNAVSGNANYGYGTYYVRSKLKQPLTEPVGLRVQSVNTTPR
ncbi:hypothetical protein N0M98_30970 [Paenibacillus doosanensis]|uniref:hypothetical protein n=1 Tax=Paenibacillus doosanensis TaxID=1229154 RepID=UPI00217F3008|nr:hypothetical protein [Paenibacillus doosanensis]MCS7464525.1 hypothetical protein [Paenibacillus doosanensis]